MFSAVLVLALAVNQQITVKVGEKSDTTKNPPRVLSDTLDDDRDKRPKRARIPVTPELEASAFRDPAARTLLHAARDARLRPEWIPRALVAPTPWASGAR